MIGSVANLIVAERAKKTGVAISFLAYERIGLPLTRASGLALGGCRKDIFATGGRGNCFHLRVKRLPVGADGRIRGGVRVYFGHIFCKP